MSTILRPFKWFYHEFGVVSIYDTGRNAWLIILARTCRMFAYGTNSLILGTFVIGLVLPFLACFLSYEALCAGVYPQELYGRWYFFLWLVRLTLYSDLLLRAQLL